MPGVRRRHRGGHEQRAAALGQRRGRGLRAEQVGLDVDRRTARRRPARAPRPGCPAGRRRSRTCPALATKVSSRPKRVSASSTARGVVGGGRDVTDDAGGRGHRGRPRPGHPVGGPVERDHPGALRDEAVDQRAARAPIPRRSRSPRRPRASPSRPPLRVGQVVVRGRAARRAARPGRARAPRPGPRQRGALGPAGPASARGPRGRPAVQVGLLPRRRHRAHRRQQRGRRRRSAGPRPPARPAAPRRRGRAATRRRPAGRPSGAAAAAPRACPDGGLRPAPSRVDAGQPEGAVGDGRGPGRGRREGGAGVEVAGRRVEVAPPEGDRPRAPSRGGPAASGAGARTAPASGRPGRGRRPVGGARGERAPASRGRRRSRPARRTPARRPARRSRAATASSGRPRRSSASPLQPQRMGQHPAVDELLGEPDRLARELRRHRDVAAQQGDPAELGEQQRPGGEVADAAWRAPGRRRTRPRRAGSRPSQRCISAGGSEQLAEQLVVADPPGGGERAVEQLRRRVLVAPAAGRDRQAAQGAGDGAVVTGPLGVRERLLPQLLRLRQPGAPGTR